MIGALTQWLYELPNLMVLGVFVCLITVPVAAAPWIGSVVLRLRPSEQRDSVSLDAFKAIGPLITIVVGFSLLQAVSTFNQVQRQVDREATDLQQVDGALSLLGAGERVASVRNLVRDYAASVVEREWPALKQGRRSDDTDAAFKRMVRGVHGLVSADGAAPQRLDGVMRNLGDAQDGRTQRLNAAFTGLPTVFWQATWLLVALLFAAALCLKRSVHSSLYAGAYAAAIALLLGLVFIVDQPFRGEFSVDSKPMQRVLARLSDAG